MEWQHEICFFFFFSLCPETRLRLPSVTYQSYQSRFVLIFRNPDSILNSNPNLVFTLRFRKAHAHCIA